MCAYAQASARCRRRRMLPVHHGFPLRREGSIRLAHNKGSCYGRVAMVDGERTRGNAAALRMRYGPTGPGMPQLEARPRGSSRVPHSAA